MMSPVHVWVWYSFIYLYMSSVCVALLLGWMGKGVEVRSTRLFGYLTQVVISGFVL